MRLERGDTVYFITGRVAPEGDETLTSLIQNLFPEEYQNQIGSVVFAAGFEKEKQLKAANVDQYYGD